LIRFACRSFADRKGRECENLSELVEDGSLEPEMIIDPQSGTTFIKGRDECGKSVFFCHDRSDESNRNWEPNHTLVSRMDGVFCPVPAAP
jgi:hypothetical protein